MVGGGKKKKGGGGRRGECKLSNGRAIRPRDQNSCGSGEIAENPRRAPSGFPQAKSKGTRIFQDFR